MRAGASTRRADCTIRPVQTITRSPTSSARRSAASVRGRRTLSSQISVRSRSVATTSTSRGKSGGSSGSGALGQEGDEVGELLLVESFCPKVGGIAFG